MSSSNVSSAMRSSLRSAVRGSMVALVRLARAAARNRCEIAALVGDGLGALALFGALWLALVLQWAVQ